MRNLFRIAGLAMVTAFIAIAWPYRPQSAADTFNPSESGSATYSANGFTGFPLLTTTASQIWSGKKHLTGWHFVNTNAAGCFIIAFDATTGVTLGTTNPKMIRYVPPLVNGVNGTYDYSFGSDEEPSIANGLMVFAAIGFAPGAPSACVNGILGDFSFR